MARWPDGLVGIRPSGPRGIRPPDHATGSEYRTENPLFSRDSGRSGPGQGRGAARFHGDVAPRPTLHGVHDRVLRDAVAAGQVAVAPALAPQATRLDDGRLVE